MLTRITHLAVPRPFSLKATVLSHGWHECAPMRWSEGGRCFEMIERLGDEVCRVSVSEEKRSARAVTLRLTAEARTLSPADLGVLTQRVRVMLRLNEDLREFYRMCAQHPRLKRLRRLGAGRIVRSADMAENILKMLCGTNTTWNQAVKMINRIAQLGPTFPHHRHLNAWPTPSEILRAGEDYLISVCRTGYRAGPILDLCRRIKKGYDPAELDRMAEEGAPTQQLLAALLAIRGIGPSSAHALLSFLGRYDRLSIDTSTVAHVSRTYLNGGKPTSKQIEAIYAPYGQWKQLVWWYESWLGWGTV